MTQDYSNPMRPDSTQDQATLLYAVTAPLWFLFILSGWIAWALISIWFLYRIVSGMVRMNKGLAMEFAA